MTQADFFEAVRRCLAGIEGISALAIALDERDEDNVLKIEPHDEDPEEVYVGPHASFAEISFNLAIPAEVQREVNSRSGYRAQPEGFRVRLGYGWQTPVSCVEVVGGGPDPRPCWGARTVYLYLKREVDRSAEKLTFACIPPIFTHAEFFLYPSEQSRDTPFWLRSHTIPAYHRFEYYFHPAEVVDPVSQFFFEAQGEVDLYYRANDDSRRATVAWAAISESVTALTDSQQASKRLNLLGTARRGSAIRQAAISLTRFAADKQLSNFDLDRQALNMYAGGTRRFAKELIHQELADRPDYPVEQFSQLVQMFESGRVVELQIVVALAASLVGAVIGAATTLIASG